MHASPIFGVLSYDTAHLPGGAMLALSFLLLFQRRVAAAINVYALQSVALAAAAVWQGWAQGWAHGASSLYLAALIALAANAIAIPIALRRMSGRQDGRRETGTSIGVFA
jgi:hydrogenase-4 component E